MCTCIIIICLLEVPKQQTCMKCAVLVTSFTAYSSYMSFAYVLIRARYNIKSCDFVQKRQTAQFKFHTNITLSHA